MICANCHHPEWEHVEGECEHKHIDDPRDSSHLCFCRNYVSSGSVLLTTKIVTMSIEIRTAYPSEAIAKAANAFLNGRRFRDGLAQTLQEKIGGDFKIEAGGSLEVEDEK